MQSKKKSALEAALNVTISTIVAYLVTQELRDTVLIVMLSFARVYVLRRIFTRKPKNGYKKV